MTASTDRIHALYDLGLAHIRSAIREALSEVDREVAAAGILHPAWSRQFAPPDSVPVSVMPPHGPVVTVDFSGPEIEASWRGVHKIEVIQKVRSFAREYKRLGTAPRRAPIRRPAPAAAEMRSGA